MRTGLLAGAIAAVVAVLVSLPLRSPLDSIFNSATVVLGVLAIGLLAGLAWRAFAHRPKGRLYYVGILAGALIVVTIIAAIGETQVDRILSFSVALAAIAVVVAGGLVPMLDRTSAPTLWWTMPAAVVIALGIGIGLAWQGDEESGDLSLPARSESASVVAQAGAVIYIVGEGSEATFTVGEQLKTLPLPSVAVMRTAALSGEVDLNGGSVIEIDLSTLTSDQSVRDRYVSGTMFRSSPIATFTVEHIGQVVDGLYDGDTVTSQVDGTLTIRGVEVPLTFDVAVRNDGDVMYILGQTTFTWKQMQIFKPTVGRVVSVEDEVKVEVLLAARPQPAADNG